jgi:general L-amino acid transport system permease protein
VSAFAATLRDQRSRLRDLASQALLFLAILGLFWWLAANAADNTGRLGLTAGFGFLGKVAGFPIGETPIAYDPASSSYGRAILVGLLNTLKVAAIGSVLATVLGVLLGVLRLSKNPLLSFLVQSYIELIRNTPLLLQLYFWAALLRQLPNARQAWNPLPGVFLSQRGIRLPGPEWQEGIGSLLLALLAALAAAFLYAAWARSRRSRAGRAPPILPVALALVVTLPVLAAMAFDLHPSISWPQLKGFNFVGGIDVTQEFAALLIGLTAYAVAGIAETVRSGIESVPKEQWEAARTLGLSFAQLLRLVVLPQTLRVVIPPMTSMYLNYAKNASLGVAIGYPEIFSAANTTMNQTGQAVELIALLMGVYLMLSLSISLLMSLYERRTRWAER